MRYRPRNRPGGVVGGPGPGMLYGLWRGPGCAGAAAATGALLGWSLLTAWNWLSGPVTQLAASVGAVLGLPAWALLLATALFPAWLCGCGGGGGSRPPRPIVRAGAPRGDGAARQIFLSSQLKTSRTILRRMVIIAGTRTPIAAIGHAQPLLRAPSRETPTSGRGARFPRIRLGHPEVGRGTSGSGDATWRISERRVRPGSGAPRRSGPGSPVPGPRSSKPR